MKCLAPAVKFFNIPGPLGMRALWLTVVMSCVLAGCAQKRKPVTAAAPPPPKPQPIVVPPAPREPLSVPQTQVHLPPPQPLNPAALPPNPPPPETAETPEPQRGSRRPAPTPAKPEPAPEPPAPIAVTPPEPERPRIQEIVPAPEQKRLLDSAENHRRVTRQRLEGLQEHQLNSGQKNLVSRIQSFMKLSDDAQARGDLRQAEALAERAELLSRELPGAK
jgi:hypothetical protein